MPRNNTILNTIEKLPEGYSEGIYNSKKYGITKTTFNKGRSFKIYGEAHGDTDFISLNYYITKKKNLLKPCEMSKQKVVHFLENIITANSANQ